MDKTTNSQALSGTLPWTRSCFVCGQDNPHGLRLKSKVENGIVVLDYTPRETELGWRHIVHGGIIMTLLDEVMTWAAMIESGHACVAVEMTTRLKKGMPVGQPVRVEGKLQGIKARKIIFTEGRLLNGNGEELAVAVGKYFPMPKDKVSHCEEDFVVGPEAIRPEKVFTV